MSNRPMSYGTNTIVLDDATLKEILQQWVQEQFQPVFDCGLTVEKVHITRGGKAHVTLRGKKAALKQAKVLPNGVAMLTPPKKATSE